MLLEFGNWWNIMNNSGLQNGESVAKDKDTKWNNEVVCIIYGCGHL